MSILWISLILIFVNLKCHWYFLQENPDTIVQILNAMGIDAYRGATQLNIIEPEKWNPHLDYFAPLIHYYPHEARYLIDHVVYLPVNKSVPFHVLDQICKGLEVAIKISRNGRGVSVRPQSKLWSQEKIGSESRIVYLSRIIFGICCLPDKGIHSTSVNDSNFYVFWKGKINKHNSSIWLILFDHNNMFYKHLLGLQYYSWIF